MTNITSYQQGLLDLAAKDARNKKNTWPGTPLADIPLSSKSDMDALIAAGLATVVTVASGRSYLAPVA